MIAFSTCTTVIYKASGRYRWIKISVVEF
jgi:hypothetical protein